MNIQSILPGRLAGLHATCGAGILLTLLAFAPARTFADPHAASASAGRITEVSLSDLNLSTPEGLRLARERLHDMAERVCADGDRMSSPSPQQAVGACVDSTVANALRRISEELRRTNMKVLNSVTLGAPVSLADLDLSTMEGARIARQRLEFMAHRLCDELTRRQDLSYQSNYAACLHDTLAGAMAQADALAAARNARLARRSAP